MLRVLYLVTSLASVGLLVAEAPRGAILTKTPEKGKVGTQAPNKKGGTIRSRPAFIFVGGYHGGK